MTEKIREKTAGQTAERTGGQTAEQTGGQTAEQTGRTGRLNAGTPVISILIFL